MKIILKRFVLAGLIMLTIGPLLNRLVVNLNGGMPVLGLTQSYKVWIPMTNTTKLNFLGDILSPGLFIKSSIGDLLLILGCIMALIGGFLLIKTYIEDKLAK